MTKLTIAAQITAKQEHIEAVKAELKKLIAPTLLEEGCLGYDLHQDNNNPALFLFFENWASKAALDQHMQTAHFKNFGVVTEGMVANFTLNEMTQIS